MKIRILLLLAVAAFLGCSRNSQTESSDSANSAPPSVQVEVSKASPSPAPVQPSPAPSADPAGPPQYNLSLIMPNDQPVRQAPSPRPSAKPKPVAIPAPKVSGNLTASIVALDYSDGKFHAIEYYVQDKNRESVGEIFRASDHDGDGKTDDVVYQNSVLDSSLVTIKVWHGPECATEYERVYGIRMNGKPDKQTYGYIVPTDNLVALYPLKTPDKFLVDLFGTFDELFAHVDELNKQGVLKPAVNPKSDLEIPDIPMDDAGKAIIIKVNTLLGQRQNFARYQPTKEGA